MEKADTIEKNYKSKVNTKTRQMGDSLSTILNNNENIKENKNLYLIIKRFVDIVLSAISMILLSPLFLIISIIIKIDSEGPIFFKHKRIGKYGKPIYIYKFRTMCKDAESKIKEFTPEQRKEFEENFKLNDDPRITKMGRILRKTSLDELPQLLNIFEGELSFVGPRPVTEKEYGYYQKNKSKFTSVTPGLTGYWQVNGRSNTSYIDRMNMELYYIDNRSLILDTKIFLKTFAVVLKEGAK